MLIRSALKFACIAAALAPAIAGCRTEPGISPDDGPPPAAKPAASRSATQADPGPTRPAPALDPTLEALYSEFVPPYRGDPGAAVVLYVFSDYLCPACASLALEALPAIQRGFVESGRAAVSFVDFPLAGHGYPSYVAHEAAHCAAEQGRYWDMHDALFAGQEELAGLDAADEPAAQRVAAGLGARIGLNEDRLASCLASQRYRTMVAAMYQKAVDSGIDTAPTILLQSETRTDIVTGYLSPDKLESVLLEALERAPTPAP